MSRGLAWVGIGFGLVELLAPYTVARAAGLDRHAGLIRLFGIREIASGAIVLASPDPEGALWVRVAGDGMDGAVLASGLTSSNPRRHRTLLALLAVAPVVALDALYARRPKR